MPETVSMRNRIVNAAEMHVAFDGWSDETLMAAAQDCGATPEDARAFFPRGGVDLAIAYHEAGDEALIARMHEADWGEMRFRDRIATAVRWRIEEVRDKEAVRRGTTLFSLPVYAADGARLIWNTCDIIWRELGDPSTDGNWYTKRAILSGVYSSTVLFWLGDQSYDNAPTWEFLDRRIENVMQFEKFKAEANKNPLLKPFAAVPNLLLSRLKAPTPKDMNDLPGRWTPSGKHS